jgi:hypothetical protein
LCGSNSRQYSTQMLEEVWRYLAWNVEWFLFICSSFFFFYFFLDSFTYNESSWWNL